MELEGVATDDGLQSLHSAIALALENEAGSEEISRVVNIATSKFCSRRAGILLDDQRDRERCYLSKRVYRSSLIFCAVILSFVNIMSFMGQKFSQPTNFYLQDIQENIYTPQNHALIEKGDEDYTLQTATEQYKRGATFIRQFLLQSKNKTKIICPMDAFFRGECQQRSGGTVCIFPGAVLKRINKSNWKAESDAFEVLNDTKFFPELYYKDSKCQTVLQENVAPQGYTGGENYWCANYTYYENFFKSAFEVFNANNIIPVDLNVCCNTIVNGDDIRIIDFGKYKLNQPPEKVSSENEKLLAEILEELVEEMDYAKRHFCNSSLRHG